MVSEEKLINSSPADGLHGYINNTKLINIESHNPWDPEGSLLGPLSFHWLDFCPLPAVFFPPIAWSPCPSQGDGKTPSVEVGSVYYGLED